MANDDKKKFKVPRPNSNISISPAWTVIVVVLSFSLSLAFSLVTSVFMQNMAVGAAFAVLFMIVGVNVLFDLIGTAVLSAEESPFHSLCARKVRGAREAVSIIRHAPQVANVCCDVIGDIAGIISGAATALIVSELAITFGINALLPSLLLTGLVGAMTIGGKAVCKGVAMKNGNSVVFMIGKIMALFKKKR
ncbi:MAG: hypothetical protein PUF72_10700 [Clostridiales bacterium]|nr:hypothetical protein [Clostridiales bacterium]